MNNIDTRVKMDLRLCDIIEKYSEWLEMSTEPEFMLIEILTNMLVKSEDEVSYLKKIAYIRPEKNKTQMSEIELIKSSHGGIYSEIKKRPV